jgi:hypothetical protein
MLRAMTERLPELYAFGYSAYNRPSVLYYGRFRISSQVGPQQGDPLGPLLFSNTIHPLLLGLGSTLVEGYLDDLTLGGPADVVARDVIEIIKVGRDMGLCLNVSKCELISHDGLQVPDGILQSFTRISIRDAALLGAPLFHGAVLDREWSERCSELAVAASRLKSLRSQDALILLRASFSATRVMHLLRCAPSVGHTALQSFDDQLRSAVQRITNSTLTHTQWLQASLPVRDGGLGVRRVMSLALPAYIASAVTTTVLQEQILARCQVSPDRYLLDYLSAWSATTGLAPFDGPMKQSAWDRPLITLTRRQIEEDLATPFHQASFLAASASHSGDWLNTLPITSCGLRLDDEAVRVAVGIRLRLDICVPHQCRCGSQVDAKGVHSLVCKQAPGRTARHSALNDTIARSFAAAGIPVSKEPVGLSRADGKRPDGMTLIPWRSGRPAVWDVTVACTVADSYIKATAQEAGAAAEAAAARKAMKYNEMASQYDVFPVALESSGTLSADACDLLADIGSRTSAVSGEARETSFLFQRISVVVQRYNAILLHDSFIFEERPD